jgi:hypothetical protein
MRMLHNDHRRRKGFAYRFGRQHGLWRAERDESSLSKHCDAIRILRREIQVVKNDKRSDIFMRKTARDGERAAVNKIPFSIPFSF